LQGVKTPAEFSILFKMYLETQRIYDLTQGLDSFAAAARMFFDCQRAGLTIRRGADLLIAQTAIEHKLKPVAFRPGLYSPCQHTKKSQMY
jgi:hypothetical protein